MTENTNNLTSDTAFLVVGRWQGKEQIWRGGVFDTPDDATNAFAQYQQDEATGGEYEVEFVRVIPVSSTQETNIDKSIQTLFALAALVGRGERVEIAPSNGFGSAEVTRNGRDFTYVGLTQDEAVGASGADAWSAFVAGLHGILHLWLRQEQHPADSTSVAVEAEAPSA